MAYYASERSDDDGANGGRSRIRSHASGGALAEKLGDMLDGGDKKNSLPMYKDKSYNYPGSRRRWQSLKRKRNLVGFVLSVLVLFYLFSSRSSAPGTAPSKSWRRKPLAGVDWEARQARVKDAFKLSWAGYEKYAWGYDEYHPKSKSGRHMVERGLGWIIVDALDTLMLMNMTTELTHAREWVATSLTYDQDHDINTFENTIRMLGGLLAAHYLSTEHPTFAPVTDKFGQDLYLEKASDLADRLTFAYNSKSGVPFASLNPQKRQGILSHADGGASSTAEATSLQLEMKYMAKLTGEKLFWQKAEKVMQVVDDNGAKDGLLPIFINPSSGNFYGNNIRLGSRGDSYYEYLIKQYLQTSQNETIYLDMWNQALSGINKHLITYTKHANLTVLGERPHGLEGAIFPKMDHLVCFMPGTMALGVTRGKTLAQAKLSPGWGAKQEAEMELAIQLTKTCWGMYKVTATGLAPEIAHFHLHDPPIMSASDGKLGAPSLNPQSPDELSPEPDAAWRLDYDLHGNDLHNLQRPETVETLFYMWRITKDVKYREWGWEMFQSFVDHTALSEDVGFSSISNVNQIPTVPRDNMESFWLAETLKYFYLLFGPDDVLPLDKVVFNTEAHPLPVFEMGKMFSTGWTRKRRDAKGEIIRDAAPLHEEQVMRIQTAPSS